MLTGTNKERALRADLARNRTDNHHGLAVLTIVTIAALGLFLA